jgi:hypothetical protein
MCARLIDRRKERGAIMAKLRMRTWGVLQLGALLLGCAQDDGAAVGRSESSARYPGPSFAGAGTGAAGASLAIGAPTVTCDGRGASPVAPFAPGSTGVAHRTCFFSDDPAPDAMIEWIVESAPAQDDLIHVRLTMNPAFVDNTYGAGSIGWSERAGKPPNDKPRNDAAKPPAPSGANPLAPPPADPRPMPPKPDANKAPHTFRDLVGSDHAEFELYDAEGREILRFKSDYLSEVDGTPSGYASLGVRGGDGKMLVGRAEDVVAVSTSLERNLNVCGFSDYLVDSPATDASYKPNALTPEWDYRVVYDVWVRKAAFGSAGFGKATVDFVHASPSKTGGNTVVVVEDDCPPDWPYCTDPEGCECVFVPDGSCTPGKVPPPKEPEPECEGFDCGL